MKTKIAAVVSLSLVFLALVALYLTRSRAVLFELNEAGDPLGPAWSILHPFRDRAPERAANALLRDLKCGDVASALSTVPLPDDAKEAIQAKELQHPLRSWTLISRSDTANRVELSFMAARGESADRDSPLWVTVVQTATNRRWEVQSFESWY